MPPAYFSRLQVRVTVIATGFNDNNVQQANLPSAHTIAASRPAPRKASRPSTQSARPTQAPAPAPTPAPRPAAMTNDKEFDIPDFLKRSRI